MGVCGTGMAALAGMLKEKGFHVTGSDQNIYPPMSLFLEKLSIPILKGYDKKNLDPPPDLVIVGNVITRDNPEAVALARLGIPYLSFPQALRVFAMGTKRSIVVSGTHGKTTTSSLVAWFLEKAGMDPGFMIGGMPLNFQTNFKLAGGAYYVVEGDEYDTAFFDKGPKFLHYNPWATILTSIEFDHADIYRDLDHVVQSFRKLIRITPSDGILIAHGDDPVIAREIGKAPCPVLTYAFEGPAHWHVLAMKDEGPLTRLTVEKAGGVSGSQKTRRIEVSTPLYGRHNMENLLGAVALADFIGIPHQTIADAAKSFMGVKRRQEKIVEKRGICVLDDFAHHPSAVKKTIDAVKKRYKGRRLIAVFEPRSNSSRRNIFQNAYTNALDQADFIFIPEPPLMEKIPPAERFSSIGLVRDLRERGIRARYFPNTGELLEGLLGEVHPGDVVLIMSNGAFDHLHQRLADRL